MFKNKIKAIFFDLDGTLVDTQDIHYRALNIALYHNKCEQISLEDHNEKFDGLSTYEKLNLLNINDKFLRILIFNLKQAHSNILINKEIRLDLDKYAMIGSLFNKNYEIKVVTNCSKESTFNILKRSQLSEYFKEYNIITKDDFIQPKPSSECYVRALLSCSKKYMPENVLIVEDSKHGIQSAKNTGCHVLELNNYSELNYELVMNKIKEIEGK